VIGAEKSGIRQELFGVRRGSGRPRYLVRARREPCFRCNRPTRIVSVWVTPRRVLERIAWCRYCFEAECRVVKPSEAEEVELEATLRAVEASAPIAWFDCARPAAEELERRGML
jgi:hypothetical protein